MVVQVLVALVLGACCLLLLALSCVLSIVGWLLRRTDHIRSGRKAAVADESLEIVEGEFREMEPDGGKRR